MEEKGISESKKEKMEKAEVKEKVTEVGGTASEKNEIVESEGKSRRQAEKFFNDFTSYIKDRQQEFGKTISDYTTTLEKPLSDVIETENEIIIKTDLPGVKKNDIEINLTDNSVEITAKFEEEHTEEDVNYLKKERSFGETTRFIELPEKIIPKNATAKLEESILTITMPKLEKKQFKVDIN